ncbi:hypothetical protein ACIBKY_12930 [Nonomuraea sp. NPDC050394]|uniref:LIC_13387 family protein n=1 Tax=Nonomuraea sp. NPDC050394 TaxID=3364363 RepID=UPI0037959312
MFREVVMEPWSRRLFYAGATLIGLIGVAHLLMFHSPLTAPLPAGEQAVADLAAVTASPMFENGRQVTVRDFNDGTSAEMGMLAMMFAVAVVVAVREAPGLLRRWSPFSLTCTAVAGFSLWLCVRYFPEPLIVLTAISTVCFGLVFAAPFRPASLRSPSYR